MRTLSACQKKKIIHTALDDLESFLWLLIWCFVHASKDIEGAKAVNEGIQVMLEAWSGDLRSNRSKLQTVRDDWRDAVSGDKNGWVYSEGRGRKLNKVWNACLRFH